MSQPSTTPKSYTRTDIQTLLTLAFEEVLGAAGLPQDSAHERRIIRALIHMAARRAGSAGIDVLGFATAAANLYLHEFDQTPAEALVVVPGSGLGKGQPA